MTIDAQIGVMYFEDGGIVGIETEKGRKHFSSEPPESV